MINFHGAGLSVLVTKNWREMRNIRFDSNSVNRWRIRKKILLIVNIYSIIRPVTSIFTYITAYDEHLLCSDLETRVPI